ncbi:hypothetical protein [Streptomyces sp. NPDC018693]|uniref:hypothetical protein n=1 Tax=unclassified Streptomyces TaxID=2593676 RepID=UPI0037BD20CD
MRSTAVRRTALAASAAALALLATACGSEDADKAKGGETSQAATPAASAAPAAAKALTAAELEKAALTQADAKSGKVTEKLASDDDVAQDGVVADKPACAPLALLQVGSYVGEPAATVKRKWQGEAEKPAAGATEEEAFIAGMTAEQTVVTLASYAEGGAEQAMKDLVKAATECAGGFSFTESDETTKVQKVATTDAPKGADEALAVTMTVDFGDDVVGPTKSVVVRKGATLAYFPVLNPGAIALGEDYEFPTALLDAQLAKLS